MGPACNKNSEVEAPIVLPDAFSAKASRHMNATDCISPSALQLEKCFNTEHTVACDSCPGELEASSAKETQSR